MKNLQPLDGLCRELKKMTGQNVVETLNLRIRIQHANYDCTRWDELNDVLMGSPEGWPVLRKVSILFIFFMTSRDDPDEVPLELPMTKLVESKRVQFDFKALGLSCRMIIHYTTCRTASTKFKHYNKEKKRIFNASVPHLLLLRLQM